MYLLVSITLKEGVDKEAVAQILVAHPEVERVFTLPFGEYSLMAIIFHSEDEPLFRFVLSVIRQLPGYKSSHTEYPNKVFVHPKEIENPSPSIEV